MNPGRAKFEFIGTVGKLTQIKSDKTQVFVSLAVDSFFNEKVHTTWHNNVVAYGKTGERILERAVSGTLVYLSGIIGNYKTKTGMVNTTFIVSEFLVLRKTKAQQEEDIQKYRAKKISEEDAYNEPEESADNFSSDNNSDDDLPY